MSILINDSGKSQKIGLSSSLFPESLKQIDTPPRQIYWRGANPREWIDKPKVAIVGSRKATSYGRLVTEELTASLVKRGVVVISGLALGIDSIAHHTAVGLGGVTVAVLPTPLSKIYPSSHLSLANNIIESGGTLISEYGEGEEVFKINFIARNRIVSALADILLITEATAASGTMHTARFALSQGKTVMAVPGNITQEGSQGTNNLIKSGAVPVTEVNDVLFALGLPSGQEIKATNRLSERQSLVLSLIADGVVNQDDIAKAAGLSAKTLGSELTMMEIAGAIRPLGAGQWSAG